MSGTQSYLGCHPPGDRRNHRCKLGKAQAWVSAFSLFAGGAAADGQVPAEPGATGSSAALAQRLPPELGMGLASRCWRSDKKSRACTLEGDFDGDDKLDLAILVQEKSCASQGKRGCRRVGIAFLFGDGKREVLGAGRGRWHKVNDDTGKVGPARAMDPASFSAGTEHLWYWSLWRLTKQGLRPQSKSGPHPTGRPPGMRRDGIELSGGDASILIYRSAQGFIEYDLGF